MTFLIVRRNTDVPRRLLNLVSLSEQGERSFWNSDRLPPSPCAVGLLILSSIGLLASSFLVPWVGKVRSSIAVNGAAGRRGGTGSRRDPIRGIFSRSRLCIQPDFSLLVPITPGLVGLRHMLHLETDLYKQYLTFYTDQNCFSDRTNGWIELSE